MFVDTNLGRLLWPTGAWDDMVIDGFAIGANPSLNPPSLEVLTNGVKIYFYEEDETGHFTKQCEHRFRLGVPGAQVRPHVHWLSKDPSAGDSNIVCHLELLVGLPVGGNYYTLASAMYTNLYATGIVVAAGLTRIDSFPYLDASDSNVWADSSVVIGTLHRTTDGTQSGKLGLISLDLHAQVEGFGSKNELGDR